MFDLKERIGIDRTVVYNFFIKAVDVKQLENKASQVKDKSQIRLIRNNEAPIELSDGTHLSYLMVQDRYLGKMTISFEKNNLTGSYQIMSKMELNISKSQNNLQNLDTFEYQERVIDVFSYLAEEYGIEAEYSSIKIKKMEINATFYLDEPYEKYRQAILLIMRNVSPKRYGSKKNNAVKYATWHEANVNSGKDILETALVKNNSTELKIYNKKKQLQDIGELPVDVDWLDIMRVEYTIKDPRILKSNFGDNLVADLSDEQISALFKKYFNRDVASRYYVWAKNNRKKLAELVKKHREENQHWVGYFVRECRQHEAKHGLPILFDIEDLKVVFKDLETSSGRNTARKYNSFLKQAVYEEDLIGNTRRIKEIIHKVMSM